MSSNTEVDRFPYDFVWIDEEASPPGHNGVEIRAPTIEDAWSSFWKNHNTAAYVSCFLGVRMISSSEQYPNPRS